jgi:hypothetical protein
VFVQTQTTVNKLLQTLRTILAQAVAEGRIAENPATFVKPVRAQGIERGILTPEEFARLLSTHSLWDDYRHHAINLLAATTGTLGRIARTVHGEHQGELYGHVLPALIYFVNITRVKLTQRLASVLLSQDFNPLVLIPSASRAAALWGRGGAATPKLWHAGAPAAGPSPIPAPPPGHCDSTQRGIRTPP